MRLRERHAITPIDLYPGDTISVNYTDSHSTRRLIQETVDRALHCTEVAILYIEDGDFPGVAGGIGGCLLELT